jgi:hypothetical protein
MCTAETSPIQPGPRPDYERIVIYPQRKTRPDYRFNSFYRETPHAFVVAMLNTLEAAQAAARELRAYAKVAGLR